MLKRNLRVGFVVGTMRQGGAEKQMAFMIRALCEMGVEVRVYSLTRGEFYESHLEAMGIHPVWIGEPRSVAARLVNLFLEARKFRPHILQATHFFVNLYVYLAARLLALTDIGSIRSDALYDVRMNGRWGSWLLRLPTILLANSGAAQRNARALGRERRTLVCPNVLDLKDFDIQMGGPTDLSPTLNRVRVMAIGSLIHTKRLDRFVNAISIANRAGAQLEGVIIGDGPEREHLQDQARESGLDSSTLRFLGARANVAPLLRDAHIVVLTSDHEGFPNVLLEAMAARLPVITTPAGDAPFIVEENVSGYIVPFDDETLMANRIQQLAASAELRRRMGEQGRKRVETSYSFSDLGSQLLSLYDAILAQRTSPSSPSV